MQLVSENTIRITKLKDAICETRSELGYRRPHVRAAMDLAAVIADTQNDKTKAEAAENAEPVKPEAVGTTETEQNAPKRTIGHLVEKLLMDEALDYMAIVEKVVDEFPDAKTTVRSVASVAAVMRKRGAAVPMRRKTRG